MIRLTLLFTLFIYFQTQSQSTFWQPYQFPEKNPFFSSFNLKKELSELSKIDKIIGDYKMSSKDKKDFIEEIYYYKKELFLSGGIYFNYGKYENYLNGLLLKIIPNEYKNDQNIHVYLGKTYDSNAYCLFDGTIIFNIGLLSKMHSEDQIVQILAHELTHYINKDVLRNYTIFKKSNKKNIITKYLNIAHYSRVFESQADSLSFILTHNAKYNLKDCYKTFELFSQSSLLNEKVNDENIELVIDDTINEIIKNLRSHPESLKRKEKAEFFIKNHTNIYSTSGDSLFSQLTYQAKYEELQLLLSNHLYNNCTLIAFNYHLKYNNDPIFIYFILESVRRDLIIHPSILDKPFLQNSLPFLNTTQHSIYSNPQYIGVNTNSNEYNLLLDYKNNISTYKKAILFFTELSNNYEYPELLFTKSLIFYNDSIKRTDFLNKYISKRDILFRTLSENILANCINWLGKPKYNIYICPEFSFYKGDKFKYEPYSSEYNKQKNLYLLNLNNDLRYKDKNGKFLLIDSLLFLNLNEKEILFQVYEKFDYIHKYHKVNELKNSNNAPEEINFNKNAIKQIANPIKSDLYVTPSLYFIFPEAYQLFTNNNFNSINFISLVSYNHQFKITTEHIFNKNSFKQEYWDLGKINPYKLSEIVTKIILLNINH